MIIKDIAEIKKGDNHTFTKKNASKMKDKEYSYPFFSCSLTNKLFVNEYNREKNKVVMVQAYNSGDFQLIKENFFISGDCFTFEPKKDYLKKNHITLDQFNKIIMFTLECNKANFKIYGNTVKRIDINSLLKLKVIIPNGKYELLEKMERIRNENLKLTNNLLILLNKCKKNN